ncbi:hypothetical protein, partial [Lactococcus cremoris]|uniref:hypothetical protein n=1 Tax=Lactococcus lactis subsp. cremoris TaxID=1359 RepID=UPI001E39FEC1
FLKHYLRAIISEPSIINLLTIKTKNGALFLLSDNIIFIIFNCCGLNSIKNGYLLIDVKSSF